MDALPPEQALELLLKQRQKAMAMLKQKKISEKRLASWRRTTIKILLQALTSPAGVGEEAAAASARAGPTAVQSVSKIEEERRRNLAAYVNMLDTCIEQLEPPESSAGETGEEYARGAGRKVFVIHGSDEAKKEVVARLLERLKLVPIILHEQANYGLTIIEKIERYADVRFAVVILSGDDTCIPAAGNGSRQLRARQNVIFELGYFVARLGRERVCALYQPQVELPSDFHGVVYIPLDEEGAWKIQVVRELKAAGIKVDANLVL